MVDTIEDNARAQYVFAGRLPQGCLFARTRRVSIDELRGPEAAQVRHDDATTSRGKDRRDLGVGLYVIREAVHYNTGGPSAGPLS